MAGAAPGNPQVPGGTFRSMPVAAVVLLLGMLGTHEGLKQTPYRDQLAPGKPWTVCRGITGPKVIPGKRYSIFECNELEAEYVAKMAKRMERCLAPHVALSVWEWVAWGDFAYNLGTARFCGSTALKLLNVGERSAACNQIPRWTYTNGKDCRVKANQCDGIIKRRTWEHLTCRKGLSE